jgi:AraC family transcriptional regulator
MNRIDDSQPCRADWGAGDTHEIGLWPRNRLIAQSAGRGWRNVHAALATVNSWSGVLPATGHPCVAYCLHRPARLQRRLQGGGVAEARTVRPRQFLVIPGHAATEWHRHGSSDMLMLYLRQDMIDAVASECPSLSGRSASLDLSLGTVDPLLEQLVLSVLQVLKTTEDGSSALYVDSLVRTLVMHLLRRRGTSAEDERPPTADQLGMGRVLDLIEAELGMDLTIPLLAREAQQTAQTFARTFRRSIGTTVHQYVLSRRLERAKDLLVSTDLPVVDVAQQTGFASQSHLATALKRLTGVTPGQFRRSLNSREISSDGRDETRC